MREKCTREMMLNWVGNRGYAEKQLEWMLGVLVEIANGEYTPDKLAEEVREYNGG